MLTVKRHLPLLLLQVALDCPEDEGDASRSFAGALAGITGTRRFTVSSTYETGQVHSLFASFRTMPASNAARPFSCKAGQQLHQTPLTLLT